MSLDLLSPTQQEYIRECSALEGIPAIDLSDHLNRLYVNSVDRSRSPPVINVTEESVEILTQVMLRQDVLDLKPGERSQILNIIKAICHTLNPPKQPVVTKDSGFVEAEAQLAADVVTVPLQNTGTPAKIERPKQYRGSNPRSMSTNTVLSKTVYFQNEDNQIYLECLSQRGISLVSELAETLDAWLRQSPNVSRHLIRPELLKSQLAHVLNGKDPALLPKLTQDSYNLIIKWVNAYGKYLVTHTVSMPVPALPKVKTGSLPGLPTAPGK